MNLWEIANSSIVITIITLVVGSILASWLTAMWQRRAKQYEIKLQQAEKLLLIYHEYIRILKGDDTKLRGEEFDRLHSQLYALSKITGLVFKDKHVGKNWKDVADTLAKVRQLRLTGKKPRDTKVTQLFNEIYEAARVATEKMFTELLK